jgi:hypothetical protein
LGSLQATHRSTVNIYLKNGILENALPQTHCTYIYGSHMQSKSSAHGCKTVAKGTVEHNTMLWGECEFRLAVTAA